MVSGVSAQHVEPDTLLHHRLEDVIVTATRGSERLGDLSVPADVVTRDEIEARGSVRLDDLLSQIAGYTPVNAFGSGVQIQGLGPAYTLILIDGEPVVGRLNGTLDLDRLGLHDVERVEVVRGPFSSLYGSEAIAGVINLISRTPSEPFRGSGALRLEAAGTVDASTGISLRRGESIGRISLRHYRSSAYDLDPTTIEPTFPAYDGTDVSASVSAPLPLELTLRARGRMGREDQREGVDVALPPGSQPLTGQGLRTDWSAFASLQRVLWSGAKGTVQLYASRFQTETELGSTTGNTINSRFEQTYRKGELKVDALVGGTHLLTVGGGVIAETVDADRIRGESRSARTGYAFAQEQWIASPAIEVVTSARVDAPSDYSARVSPAASILVKPFSSGQARLSLGSGFKAPTFQQRYLDFTNAAAGYTVVGASDVGAVLAEYEAQGLIEYRVSVVDIGAQLRPETSYAANVGVEIYPAQTLTLRANGFYNHLSDLIEIVPVAALTNGRDVYTYVNLDRVRTSGVELGAEWSPLPELSLEGRYNFLDSADLGALDDIDAGLIFRRDDGRDRVLRRDEYGGLWGRSAHSMSAHARLQTPLQGLGASLGAIYRSRYGDFDRNGNLVLDDASEYVPGYVLMRATLTYDVRDWLSLQVGLENIFDYTNPARIPALPGRLLFGAIRVTRANA